MLLCIVDNYRMLIKSSHTFIRPVFAKKPAVRWNRACTDPGQSSFLSVCVRRCHVTDHSFRVIVRMFSLSKLSFLCLLKHPRSELPLTETEFNSIKADDQWHYLLMLQSTNKNPVTDVSVLYANRNFMDQFSLPPRNICSWKIEIQLHGTKWGREKNQPHAADQAGSREKAICRCEIK